MSELVHTETDGDVIYRVYIEQDETAVRGNAMASGDRALDKEVEDEILQRLDDGETWAWASVTVTANHVDLDGQGLEGRDYLGGCCYRDTEEFIACPYYQDMKVEALAYHDRHVMMMRKRLLHTNQLHISHGW